MLRSISVQVLRSFKRNAYYTFITLTSLTVAITTAILMFLWDRYEIGFNKQIPDAERVYTLLTNEEVDGEVQTEEGINVPLMDFLSDDVAEVEFVTRIDNTQRKITVDKTTILQSGVYADVTFFNVFQSEILKGSMQSPGFPNSISISEEVQKLLFPNGQVIGNFVTIDNNEFIVSSVFRPFPKNNSLSYVHFVLPYNSRQRENEDWVNYYVKLNEGASKTSLENKINTKYQSISGDDHIKSFLFPLSDWYLHWNFENGVPTGGRIVYLVIFNITAAFIVIMACINYVNISTARSTRRAKEIGVRKVAGANQNLLIKQFLAESTLFAFTATVFSLFIVYLFLPVFQGLTGLPLEFDLTDPVLITGLAGITLFAGISAGCYPAFLLSSFKPATVLKGNIFSTLGGAKIRKGLVAFQFSLSLVMIFIALLIGAQTDFLLKRDVGYDKHNIINVWLPGDVRHPVEGLKAELSQHSEIKSVAFAGASPMEINGSAEVKWSGMMNEHPVHLYGSSADADMIATLGLKIIQGRNFSKDLASDSMNFIINKSAAQTMGLSDPIGKKITYTMDGERSGEIIGVIDDFNNDDIHLPMAPVIFFLGKNSELYNLFVRYENGKQEQALQNLKSVFHKHYPGFTFDYSFLDNDFEMQMHQEKFLHKISLSLTLIAIIIAVLGLLGLALFNAERRTKEIGIRKVLGASVPSITVLMFKEFLAPVLIAIVIAFPVAQYLGMKYLESFAYQVTATTSLFFLVALGAVLCIGILVSLQSYKASVANPVNTLKQE